MALGMGMLVAEENSDFLIIIPEKSQNAGYL